MWGCRFPACSTDQKQCIHTETGVCEDFYEEDEEEADELYSYLRNSDPGSTGDNEDSG